MKHETATNQEIANLIRQNQSFEDYFSKQDTSKNNQVAFSINYSEVAFVVEWQMEKDKQENSLKF